MKFIIGNRDSGYSLSYAPLSRPKVPAGLVSTMVGDFIRGKR